MNEPQESANSDPKMFDFVAQKGSKGKTYKIRPSSFEYFDIQTFNRFAVFQSEEESNEGSNDQEKSLELQKRKEKKKKRLDPSEDNKKRKRISQSPNKTDCSKIEQRKKKCRNCGLRKNCRGTSYCKSFRSVCFFCSKHGHFPKSLNCKKRRKMLQNKKQENKLVYGCQRLREFLNSHKIKLNSGKIPYKEFEGFSRRLKNPVLPINHEVTNNMIKKSTKR